jgi:hypothetical protein
LTWPAGAHFQSLPPSACLGSQSISLAPPGPWACPLP